MALQDIYKKASLVMKPAAMKEGKLYSQQPHSGDGDFTFSRANGTQTRINKHGLIEAVADNTPRLSYELDSNGNVSECPNLLLEPTRTNFITRSEELDNAYWTKARSSITANQTTSPDGSNTADKLIDSTDNNTHIVYRSFTVSTSNAYAFSCFLKKGSLSKAFLAFDSAIGQTVVFDLENGTVESEGIGVTSSSIVEYPNDWYKCSLTHTPTTTSRLYRVGTYNGSISYTGTGTDFVYLWGAQLEVGSYPTSYIPTSGSEVERELSTVKIENFTDTPTSYPFTAFVDMDVIEDEKGYGFSILDISSSSNYWSVGYSEDSGNLGKFRFTNRAQGTAYNFNTTSTYGTGRYKIAVKFISATNFKAFIDGTEVANYTHSSSAFNTNANDILLGQLRVLGDTTDRTPIHQFTLFNEELSDSELIELTS